EPLLAAAREAGVRMLSYARPSYGGSTPRPGRDTASAADDVARVAGAFGVGRFAVLGYSGGGAHALACGALLPDRAFAVVTLAGMAPRTEDDDWYAGSRVEAAWRAAALGREARLAFVEHDAFDPE